MRQVTELPQQVPSLQKTSYTQQDLRKTELWTKVDEFFSANFDPTNGKLSGATDLNASPDGKRIAFTGSFHGSDWRETPSRGKICIIDVESSTVDLITSGTSSERLPKWSPDGNSLTFLSDRDGEKGFFQLFKLTFGELGEAKAVVKVDGMVERYHWNANGGRLLIQAAGRDADREDGSGSGKIGGPKTGLPAWMPKVDSGDLSEAWRSLWVYDLKDAKLTKINPDKSNSWEASWCGPDAIVSVASDSPLEDAWYNSTVRVASLLDGSEKIVYTPKRQLNCAVASPSGEKIAVIEACASDRGLTAGDIKIIDSKTGTARTVPLQGARAVDVTNLIWRDENNLFYIGIRGLQTVAGQWPPLPWEPAWITAEMAGEGMGPVATLLPDKSFATLVRSWEKAAEIRIQSQGKQRTLISFDHKGLKELRSKVGNVEPFSWEGLDGLAMEGFLYFPKKEGKWSHLPRTWWSRLGYQNAAVGPDMITFLNMQGYAVFCPNPRGSTGRGQDFSERVLGDMGGLDAQDILLGVEAVCKSDTSRFDTSRIGLYGGSYGGYMASLLPTLSPMFATSVSVAAVTDWHSFHTTSNIPTFDQLFLDADPYDIKGGKYLTRSPIMEVGKYPTPVLQTSGALDLAVPTSQAVQYHQAMLMKGRVSAIAIYPGEGHGVHNMPTLIDFYVRVFGWFEKFMAP